MADNVEYDEERNEESKDQVCSLLIINECSVCCSQTDLFQWFRIS